MLKNILNLDGALGLTSAEQKEINGGLRRAPKCTPGDECGVNMLCDSYGQCTIFFA